MTIFTPSSAEEIEPMLTEALHTPGPSAIRFPKTSPPERISTVGHGLHARLAQPGDSLVCILAVGKALEYAEGAARLLKEHQVSPTVWDVRVVSPPDPEMLYDALSHSLVVTVEDGMRYGGAGSYLYQSMMDLCLPSTAGNNASSVPGESDILHVPYHLCLGLPRCHLAHNRPSNLLESVGLSAKGVMESILSAIEAFRLPLDDHVLQDMG